MTENIAVPIFAFLLGALPTAYLVRRNSVLALAVIFIALNALTAGTGQEAGLIVTCLALSLIVVGTHGLRTYKNFVPAIRRGDWRAAIEHE